MEIRNYIVDHLKPVTYFTFDDDQIDLNGQSTQLTNPFIMIDESGHDNHASVYSELKNNQSAYKLGQQALTTKKNTLNRSMRFNGIANNYENAPKAVMTIPTSSTNNLGSDFTVSFNFKYGSDVTWVTSEDIRKSKRPIIVNKDRLEVFENYSGTSYDVFYITLNGVVIFQDGIGNIRENGLHHFIIRKRGLRAETWVNGNLHQVTNIPNNTLINDWQIGGTSIKYDDYHYTHTLYDWYIDNFFILDYYISDQQIIGLSKRMFYYEDMIEYAKPTYHLQCYDVDINHPDTIETKIGIVDFIVDSSIEKDKGFNKKVGYESNSIFLNGSNRLYTNRRRAENQAWFQGDEYSVGIWVKLENDLPSTIVDIIDVYGQKDTELRCHIQANISHGEHKIGIISAYDEYNNILYSDRSVNLVDGQWHHILFESAKDECRLYIDGIMTDFRKRYNHRKRIFRNMSIFSTVFKTHYSQGFIHDFVFFPKILNDVQKQLLYGYGLQYLIRGRTTYKGIPRQTDIRVLDYDSYELLYTGKSDYKGEFKIPLKSQQRVVVNVFDHNNETVDMNIRGAIVPYVEFEEK